MRLGKVVGWSRLIEGPRAPGLAAVRASTERGGTDPHVAWDASLRMASAVAHQIEALVQQLQQEGVLDDQFQQLMLLQDESNPDFVAEVVQLYFEDSGAKIDRIGQMLSSPAPDYNEVDQLVHQFKGSSASLGAKVIAQLCIRLREHCQHHDNAGCLGLQQQIKQAYADLKSKLEVYMHLEAQRKQLLAAGMA